MFCVANVKYNTCVVLFRVVKICNRADGSSNTQILVGTHSKSMKDIIEECRCVYGESVRHLIIIFLAKILTCNNGSLW